MAPAAAGRVSLNLGSPTRSRSVLPAPSEQRGLSVTTFRSGPGLYASFFYSFESSSRAEKVLESRGRLTFGFPQEC
ncbi:Hypothetical protein NTJ_09329 [Nesidiocoris tenuis]|uniref:RRM domain-containing protein n=1 Tax=Nesidiocoris tenuis TaxID=355587 RepID=A0ABN7AX30_9HEMI|nr:Hypothetical protein NTJ_09329 [Nesidiocoris tenuis]